MFFFLVARDFEGEEEYLDIQGITREQSGKYECKAANEVASADVKQVRITVNCEYCGPVWSRPARAISGQRYSHCRLLGFLDSG